MRTMYAGSMFAVLLLTGCHGPFKEPQYEEIHTNETAFLVPLEGDLEKQQQSKSVESLEKAKVLAKRVEIPLREHTIGRGWGNYQWVPTMKVIRVDRSPISRNWTADKKTGTSANDQALYVESKDSINFGFNATVTAHIEEAQTARFLYYFAGKQLTEIIDQNVRGIALQLLSAKAGQEDLAECIKQKHEFMEQAEEELKRVCLEKGITIDFFGGINGIQVSDAKIQTAVDAKFIHEIDAQTAEKNLEVQATRNEIAVASADAERQAAQELFAAKEALTLKTQLDVMKLNAEAMKIAAERWKGAMPSGIIPAGSGLLFGLEQEKEKLGGTKESLPTPTAAVLNPATK